MRKLLLFKLFLLPIFTLAQGPISGFLPGATTTDLAIGYSPESYDFYFFGDEKQEQQVSSHSYNIFIEHGFSPRSSLVLNIPYIVIDEENAGLQDATLALKYRNQRTEYANGNMNFITSVGLTFPISDYPTETDTPIGIKAFTFQGRLVAQYNWNYGTFLHIQSGLDFQFIPVSRSSIPVQIRAGMGAANFYFDVWLEWMNAINAGVDTSVTGGEGSSWLKTGGTFYYPFTDRLGAFAGMSYVLTGQNIGQSLRFNVGAVYKWNRKKDD